ncbi:MAG: sulfurtransferase TusA family protein [Actinomycetota bacterium]
MYTQETNAVVRPNETAVEVTRSIDARGMACPGPLMTLIGAIREGQVSDVIEVLSSDEGSKTDIPAWVAKAQHELVEVVPEDAYSRFIIRKVR